ncbi:SDR family oxidoreductase [Mastigocoleus testarum]|uniref:NAD-dependent epimerase/dehydratase domain-containing protein n=1 Tax=Mastigocoleus testarum BC008 TaxID=371196 RepID=A0A0V7ZYJ5_9CYAN|nr:aldehyde reductase [Mastigocoleus testarum]KST69486.1 hypothetical protein BC008_04090 [Mastigocoleus testarum BC008]KST69548.1 hypothetical protein BC008_04400 [Mastigocoleus testarum BC008]
MQKKTIVLVTGASGFIGAHCVLALLKKGYAVRAVVRSESRIEKCKALINEHCSGDADVEYAIATLDADRGWDTAVEGCKYVIHVASPLPLNQPSDPNKLIIPARDGTLRVLKAASRAGVKRIVITSSEAAVCGSPLREKDYIYDEKDWTDLSNKTVTAYNQSKTIAERAAWNFVNENNSIELATVCPGVVLGPMLEPKVNTSLELIKRLMNGSMLLIPPIGYEIVDVRDVADLHLLAMEKPNGAGGRFIASAGFMWLEEVAETLRSSLGKDANKVPTRHAPTWLVRFLALFDPTIRIILPDLNQLRRTSYETSRRELGWIPRPPDEAAIATAKSLLAYGILDRNS